MFGKQIAPRQRPEGDDQVVHCGGLGKLHFKSVATHQLRVPGERHHAVQGHPAGGSSSFATRTRNSLLGLKTGTGRAATSTGSPVRGLRAMRVLRRRILKVPKPRTSMFCWSLSASLIASRKASTTRAQSFLEIMGPDV